MEDQLLWNTVVPKVKLIGNLAKFCKEQKKIERRSELIKFVEHMVEDLKECGDQTELEPYHFRVRQISSAKTKKTETGRKYDFTFDKDGHDNFCHQCQKEFSADPEDIYPCRICTRAFHRNCVESLTDSDCSTFDKTFIDRAKTNIGWSCFICTNLTSLLDENEMVDLMEAFENIDKNKDSFISFNEFMKYKDRIGDIDKTEDGIEQLTLQFDKLDTDKDGKITYWEFICHEAKLLLFKKSTDHLVESLTEKEIVHARAIFTRMDTDSDGLVTQEEASTLFTHWYSHFNDLIESTATLNLHAQVATKMIMDHGETKGPITWEEFIHGQAIYIICSRPNI